MNKRLFVANFPFSYLEETLRGVFSLYGVVEEVVIIREKLTGKSKGFAYIEMSDEESAKAAIENLNNLTLEGRLVHVDYAKAKEISTYQGQSHLF